MGNIFTDVWSPDVQIKEEGIPKYDPMLGFPNGRKERVIKATMEEMQSAGLTLEQRDYCADDYLEFLSCRMDYFPLIYRCKHVLHKYHQCRHDDLTIRMKEFERERRLTELEKKGKLLQKKEELE